MTRAAPQEARLSVSKWAAIGAAVAAPIGCFVGLVLGLRANPATARFAIFELGIPAALLGGLAGLVAWALVSAGRWLDRKL
jgi:hypothetical protein